MNDSLSSLVGNGILEDGHMIENPRFDLYKNGKTLSSPHTARFLVWSQKTKTNIKYV